MATEQQLSQIVNIYKIFLFDYFNLIQITFYFSRCLKRRMWRTIVHWSIVVYEAKRWARVDSVVAPFGSLVIRLQTNQLNCVDI